MNGKIFKVDRDARFARYDYVLHCRDNGMTYASIGERLGISSDRVRQISAAAKRRLQGIKAREMNDILKQSQGSGSK